MIVRQVNDADQTEIYQLFRDNHFLPNEINESEFKELYKWLYFDTSAKKIYSLLIENGGEICGHHGLTPFETKIPGATIWGGLASNLLVGVKQRNAMIFMNLQKKFFSGYEANGFNFVFGLVNRPEVLRTHLKTGYKSVFSIPVFAKPINFKGLAGKKIPKLLTGLFSPLIQIVAGLFHLVFSRADRRFEISEISSFEADINPVCEKFLSQWGVHGIRNAKVLNWRFKQLPIRTYRAFSIRSGGSLGGYVVLRNMPMKDFSTVAIVDMLWNPDDAKLGMALLKFSSQFAKDQKVDLLTIMVTPLGEIKSLLHRAGFIKSPEAFTMVINEPKNKTELSKVLAAGHQWFVSWFEHDFV